MLNLRSRIMNVIQSQVSGINRAKYYFSRIWNELQILTNNRNLRIIWHKNSILIPVKDRSPDIIIMDPGFSELIGHHYDYNKAIVKSANKNNYHAVIWGHSSIKTDEYDIPVTGVFQKSYYSPPLLDLYSQLLYPVSVLISNAYFLKDLWQASRFYEIRDRLLFIHTLDHNQFLGLLIWYLMRGKRLNPSSIVVLWRISYNRYLKHPIFKYSVLFIQFLFKLFNIISRSRRQFRIVTDTNALQSEYEQYTNYGIEVFPIPHSRPNAESPTDQRQDKPFQVDRSRITISYLGDARGEKGYHLIYPAIKEIEQFCLDNNLCFWLQSNMSDFARQDPLISGAVQSLRSDKLPFIDLYEFSLSSNDYARRINTTDIVLIPYLAEDYYARSSGILMEALSANKFVIVPQNTWMAEQVIEGVNGLTFKSGDAFQLAQAIKSASQLCRQVKSERQNFHQHWLAYHSPDHFFDHLVNRRNFN